MKQTKVPGNWFVYKRPFKSFDSAQGSFLFVRRSFPLLWVPLKSICDLHFKVGAPSNSILRAGSGIFAAVPCITMLWLLEADDTSAVLQSRKTIPFLVVNVCVPTIVSWYWVIHVTRIELLHHFRFNLLSQQVAQKRIIATKRPLCKLGRSL